VSASPASAPSPVKPARFLKWHRRILGLCLVIFASELGLFLLVFPWLSNWDSSWIPLHSARFAALWRSPYFRGALGGLGLLNLYVAGAESLRQIRSFVGTKP
jgi:hypothetical protein